MIPVGIHTEFAPGQHHLVALIDLGLFRETFGVSPREFLHLRQFHALRRDLLAADRKAALVNRIAQRNGFCDMGRFSMRYKALFRESPSDTLMKPPQASQSRLRP